MSGKAKTVTCGCDRLKRQSVAPGFVTKSRTSKLVTEQICESCSTYCVIKRASNLSLGINDINGQHVIGADVTFQHVTEQAFHKILYSNLSIGSSNHHC